MGDPRGIRQPEGYTGLHVPFPDASLQDRVGLGELGPVVDPDCFLRVGHRVRPDQAAQSDDDGECVRQIVFLLAVFTA